MKQHLKNLIASLSKIKLITGIALSIIGFLVVQIFNFSVNETTDKQTFQEAFQKNYQIFSLNHPDTLHFAGEKVPLYVLDIKERFDRELLVNTYWQSNTLLMIKRSAKWFPIIEPILLKNDIPADFKFLPLIESGFTHVVSPAGAAGYWQILKTTGKEAGLEINDNVDERYHVEKATQTACNYLKEAYAKFGSWTMAAAAYNMGLTGLQNQVDKQQVTNYYELLLNDETSRYVFRILAAKEIVGNPKKYGFVYREIDLYKTLNTYEISIDTGINNLAQFALNHSINYKILKLYNPWLRGNQLPKNQNKTYKIAFPDSAYKPLYLIN